MVNGANILIVEDIESSRVALKMALGTDWKFQETEDAEKALEILKNDPSIDLILLDLHLPGMSGLEFLEKIKANKNWQDIPVLVCTASNDEKTEEDALRKGAEDYLIKPFKPTVVRQRVLNTLNRLFMKKQLEQYQINEELQKLIDNLPVGVGILEIGEKRMRPTCINKKMMQLFKLKEDYKDVFRDKDNAFIEMDRHDLNRIMSAGKERLVNKKFKAHKADGTEFDMKAIVKMQPNTDGTMTCYGIVTDLVDEK